MELYTSGDICKIANLPQPRLHEWIEKGIIKPALGAKGHGNHRLYTRMEALGVKMGAQVRQEMGCHLKFVGMIFDWFANELKEADMLAAFKEGRNHLTPCRPFWLLDTWGGADPKELEHAYNVKSAYSEVIKHKLVRYGGKRKKVAAAK